MTYGQLALEITQNPATSFWLRDAVNSLSGRDCCDALNDVQTLEALCDLRVDEVMGPIPMCDNATAMMFKEAEHI